MVWGRYHTYSPWALESSDTTQSRPSLSAVQDSTSGDRGLTGVIPAGRWRTVAFLRPHLNYIDGAETLPDVFVMIWCGLLGPLRS
ncbi:hypothetical protein RSAG8_07452, partial [Rhizoctonia solani AG-8 WAC10335]